MILSLITLIIHMNLLKLLNFIMLLSMPHVRITSEFFNKMGDLSVSHQTIQNIIFSMKNPNKIPSYLSGKFSFDVLWCKSHGKWESFYFCIIDVITKKSCL